MESKYTTLPLTACRPEMVVGWYHSHPGFGCWLSGVDINTQQSFEALNQRAVAVVVDPIQSVKGKVHGHCVAFLCSMRVCHAVVQGPCGRAHSRGCCVMLSTTGRARHGSGHEAEYTGGHAKSRVRCKV